MDFQTIDREIRVDAAPHVVYDVVSNPVHVRQWWPDEADYEPVPGNRGRIGFVRDDAVATEGFEVVEAVPSRLFSFRWTHPVGAAAHRGNSLLVTFELTPAGAGTLLRMTETGYQDRGWDAAVVEATYRDHVTGWDYFLPRIAPYVAAHVTSSTTVAR